MNFIITPTWARRIMGQTFTNQLKNYIIQNSNLAVVVDEGELQMEGEITDYRLTANCTYRHR